MDDGKIDLVRYGVLWNTVENYEQKFQSMEKKIDAMDVDLKKLVLMAERSRGSLWALMGVAGVIGSVFSFVADFVFVKR
jgi:uncharacterized protein with PhoU and TrkA domain